LKYHVVDISSSTLLGKLQMPSAPISSNTMARTGLWIYDLEQQYHVLRYH
jgi:hypothetical protein